MGKRRNSPVRNLFSFITVVVMLVSIVAIHWKFESDIESRRKIVEINSTDAKCVDITGIHTLIKSLHTDDVIIGYVAQKSFYRDCNEAVVISGNKVYFPENY